MGVLKYSEDGILWKPIPPARNSGEESASQGRYQTPGSQDSIVSTAIARYEAGAVDSKRTRLLDLSGGVRDLYFQSANPPDVLPFDGRVYLHIPSTAVSDNGISTVLPDGAAWTATRLDGTVLTGIHTTGTFIFSTPGDWTSISTDDGTRKVRFQDINEDYATIIDRFDNTQVWTVLRSITANVKLAAVVDRSLLVFGGPNGHAATVKDLPSQDADDCTVLIAFRYFSPDSWYQSLFSSYLTAGATGGFYSKRYYSFWEQGFASPIGPTVQGPGNQTKSVGQQVHALRLSKDYITTFPRMVQAARTVPALKPFGPGNGLMLAGGRGVPWGDGTAAIEFIAFAVFDYALTDDEVRRASDEMLAPTSARPVMEADAGNLLTIDQASMEKSIAGLRAYTNCTAARSTAYSAEGSASLELTSTSTTTFTAWVANRYSIDEFWTVRDTDVYTFAATYIIPAGQQARSTYQYVTWYSKSNTSLGSTILQVPIVPGTPLSVSQTLVPPAGAVYAFLILSVQKGAGAAIAVGEKVWIDKVGFWRGAGGRWSKPGYPISGLGLQNHQTSGMVEAWDGSKWKSVDNQWGQVDLWASLPSTASTPVGTRYHVTSGLGLCIAINTPTGWVVAPESNTGRLLIPPASLQNGWTGSLYVMRIGQLVQWEESYLAGNDATASRIYVAPTGFRLPGSNAQARTVSRVNVAEGTFSVTNYQNGIDDTGRSSQSGRVMFFTTDAWPTTPPS